MFNRLREKLDNVTGAKRQKDKADPMESDAVSYFVSFSFTTDEGDQDFGNIEIKLDNYISNIADVENIQELIRNELLNNFKENMPQADAPNVTVVVLNWKIFHDPAMMDD